MDTRGTVTRLLPYLKPYRARFAVAAAAMVGVAGVNAVSLWLLKPVIDQVFMGKDAEMLRLLLWLIPIVFFVKMALGYSQIYLMSWIGQRVTQDIRSGLFRHLHDLSMEFFWRKRSGEILSRVTNDLWNLQSAVHFTPLYLVRDSLTTVALLFVLFFIHWRFALFAFATLPLAAGILLVTGNKMRQASQRSQEIMGEIYHRFQESLQGMLLVKAFNHEKAAILKFDHENSRFNDQTMRFLRATALSGPLMEFLGSLILTWLIYLGGREILGERMSPGDFLAFLACFFAAYNPVKNLARSNSEIQRGLAAAGRIFELFDERPSVVEPAVPASFAAPKQGLVFEKVSFRYPDRDNWALRGLDLHVPPGEVLALAGPSGSGKTTLAHLLLRLFDPVEGRLLVDGRDLREFSTQSLRAHIGLVTQETILLHDTVIGNVRVGRPEASREEVLAALAAADAADFVSRLPDGPETMLGERGLQLSGGQRQRLAIARAILKSPSILILDEATSNLDTASETSVQASLEKLYKGRTVFIIAHRLTTLKNADRVVVLHRGEVVQSGGFEELLRTEGVFATLHALQRLEPQTGG